jgi:hypothetical protein
MRIIALPLATCHQEQHRSALLHKALAEPAQVFCPVCTAFVMQDDPVARVPIKMLGK